MKDAWPFPLPEITLLIFFAQNLTKAGGKGVRCEALLLLLSCWWRRVGIDKRNLLKAPVQRPVLTALDF